MIKWQPTPAEHEANPEGAKKKKKKDTNFSFPLTR